MAYKFIPKGKDSCNSSEKATQTWKDHFLLVLASNHLDFLLSQWCKLIEQGNITLNLLLPSRLNPKLSTYAQVFGASSYQKNPLTPTGMKVLAHVLPIYHRSFEPNEIKGFSIGVEMGNYL